MTKVAVLVGSLKKTSLNRKFTLALAKLARPKLDLKIVEIGDLPFFSSWNYDVSAQYGHTSQISVLFNDVQEAFEAQLDQQGFLVLTANQQFSHFGLFTVQQTSRERAVSHLRHPWLLG